MRESKYPQGYLPKIQYWAGQLQRAAAAGEGEKIPYIKEKLDYFLEKQKSLDEVFEIIPGTSSALRNLSIYK